MLVSLRRYLIAGLLVWLPLIVTGFIIKLLVDLLDFTILLLPPPWRPEAILGFSIPGAGIVLAVVVVFVTGVVVANIVGRKLVSVGESIVRRIPLVSSIYGAVKQVTETVLSDGGQAFRKVMLIEYPRRGLWSVGFMTGVAVGEVQDRTERDVITVFVPTTPNPTSGFVIMVPREEAIELDMTVEDGLKFVMSMGVVTPMRSPEEAPAPVAQGQGKS
ncbi:MULTISPECIES: DUF502 domain-containing protein [Thioalkalivibrio]|uniref:Membrane protein n=1 Tax=Thioalkalivibrio versutus TaxID=106634 RepID=A0A0G3G394_9GAMM|nr:MULTISPECIES: DUF502 domain-containing protein [Thioalkalivibrio]AKJ95673.1 membrane protein [Thioalkalivibrio versutus]OOC49057.1 hypothetical protein B0684_07325 [Thioalkalivibrio versutus]